MATLRPLLASLAFMCLLLIASSDFASDRAECTNQLMGLATCITYVEGAGTKAKNPTPDCCTGFKQVVGKGMRCVCLLIKDRDQPELGVKINVSLALELPHKCSTPTNISDCPRILKLPKDSADTKMYEQFAKEMEAVPTPSGTPTTSTATGKPSSSDTAATTTGTQTNGAERANQLIGTKNLMRSVSGIFYIFFPLLFLYHHA